jgi:hypothetical protein
MTRFEIKYDKITERNKIAIKISKRYNFHFRNMFLHITLKGPMSKFSILSGTFLLIHVKRFDRMLFPTL